MCVCVWLCVRGGVNSGPGGGGGVKGRERGDEVTGEEGGARCQGDHSRAAMRKATSQSCHPSVSLSPALSLSSSLQIIHK